MLWAPVAAAAPTALQQAWLLGLQADAVAFGDAEHAASTAHTYGKYQLYYARFMCRAGLDAYAFDGEEAHLILYVASLARTCKHPTICGYLNGVKQFFLDAGRLDPLRKERRPPITEFWRVMGGIRRLRTGVVKRKLPIERWMLLAFREQLDRWCPLSRSTLHLAVLTAQVIGWQAMLRISNICVESADVLPSDVHMLRRSDVRLDMANNCLWVSLRWSKTNQRGDRLHTVPIAGDAGSPLDVVALWIALCALVPTLPAGQHAFSYLNERGVVVPLVVANFVAITKRLADAVGLPSKDVSGRSFRRGGATSAFRQGVSGELIQFVGDWKSQVYLVYLEMSAAQKLAASRRMLSAPLTRPAGA